MGITVRLEDQAVVGAEGFGRDHRDPLSVAGPREDLSAPRGDLARGLREPGLESAGDDLEGASIRLPGGFAEQLVVPAAG